MFDHINVRFFLFLKVLIKGYFRAKFQLPAVSLSKVSLGGGGGGGNFYPPIIHRTPIKKPIQNRVKPDTFHVK